MASVICTPSEARVGEFVTVEGLDFVVSTLATMTVQSPNGNAGIFSSDALTDAAGEIASTDKANPAIATLTLTVNPLAAETVTLGAVTYTFRTVVTTTANEVLIGATASDTLDNLKAAVNLDTSLSSRYGSLTVVHPTVRAGNKTATTILFSAKTGGTAGNSLASTETIVTGGAFGGATFASGSAATTVNPFRFTPTEPGLWTITIADGTNTASATLRVHTST